MTKDRKLQVYLQYLTVRFIENWRPSLATQQIFATSGLLRHLFWLTTLGRARLTEAGVSHTAALDSW